MVFYYIVLYNFIEVFIIDFFNCIHSDSLFNKTESNTSITEPKFELKLQASKVSELQSIKSSSKIYFSPLDSVHSLNKNNNFLKNKKNTKMRC